MSANGHDEPVALIAFTRAAGGRVTNRMSLKLCDALEAALEALQEIRELPEERLDEAPLIAGMALR